MVSIYLKIKILKTKTIELAETDTELQESIKSLEKLGEKQLRIGKQKLRIGGLCQVFFKRIAVGVFLK